MVIKKDMYNATWAVLDALLLWLVFEDDIEGRVSIFYVSFYDDNNWLVICQIDYLYYSIVSKKSQNLEVTDLKLSELFEKFILA